MSALHLRPPAKINLGLFIKGKRPDGYHLLETLLFPLPQLSDELWLSPHFQPGLDLQMSGLPIEGSPESNLCVKAYHLLKAHLGKLPGALLRLEKRIPAGAGLGGGSADAAYTLRGLNQLFNLGLSREELHPLAAQLGADVPFFLYDQPMLATGTGTELEALPLDFPYRIELRTPGIHSSTVAAYRALDYRQCDPARELKAVLQQSATQWQESLVNDLEPPVFAQYPALAEIKAELYAQGAVYAAMSGSGSAVFGLFPA